MEKTIEIPEGYEARIEGNKVILELEESDDERIRKFIVDCIEELQRTSTENAEFNGQCSEALAYLERQKEQKPTAEEVLIRAGLKPFKDGNQWCILAGDNIQEGVCGFGDTIEDALYEFLKEVCEQQKPAEWSEKDKIHLNNAILVAKKEWGVNSYTARWLESLRDNYKKCNCHWKPSEDQIDTMKYTLGNRDFYKLKAEIEKRLKNIRDYINGAGMKYKGPAFYKARGKESAYDALLSIITSLQQEQPGVALEEEIELWFDLSGIGEAWENGEWSINDVTRTARHFYELGINARKV